MSIQPALDFLQKMQTLHEALLSLAIQKQRVVIGNKTDELMKIMKLENRVIKQIQEVDYQLRIWIAQYLHSKDFPVQYTITISEFSKYLFHPDEKDAVVAAREMLLGTLAQLKSINEQNQKMIEESLKFIDFSIDLMTGGGDDIVYQNPHQQSTGVGRSSMFDSKA